MLTTNVYTYYERISSTYQEEEQLLDLWKKTWAAQGWNPVVLTLKDAKLDEKLYEKLSLKIDAWPTVNNKLYEKACYVRWLALLNHVKENKLSCALMTDYDVINYGYTPKMDFAVVPETNQLYVFNERELHVPCALKFNGPELLSRLINDMLTIVNANWFVMINGQKHFSDMYFFMKWLKTIDESSILHLPIVSEYLTDESWLNSSLVHFWAATAKTTKESTKYKTIMAARDPFIR